jgi:hypothetical protein
MFRALGRPASGISVEVFLVSGKLDTNSGFSKTCNLFEIFYLSLSISNGVTCSSNHKVGRVLSFFSRRRNWDSPNPSPAGVCAPPPPLWFRGRGTPAGERGWDSVTICTLWFKPTVVGDYLWLTVNRVIFVHISVFFV